MKCSYFKHYFDGICFILNTQHGITFRNTVIFIVKILCIQYYAICHFFRITSNLQVDVVDY